MSLLLLLLACGPATLDLGHDPAAPGLVVDPELESVGGGANPVFSEDQIHELEIELPDESWDTLLRQTEPYSSDPVYVEGAITWDGHRVDSVGVRIKGRWGTWRSLREKASFKIDLNRYVSGQTLYGQESLTVNNLIIDCSYMREPIAYEVYEAMDIPGPRTSYVRVSVNGDDYGLYLNVESPDDTYLERHFEEPDGALYDADYILWGDGSYTILDFYAELIGYFELEEGEDPDRAGLAAIVEALDADGDLYARSGDLIDWDYHQRMVAAEMWVGQVDGYSLNRNNYLIYLDPLDGRARLLPWDHDYSFIHAADWRFDWRTPRGRLTALCLEDATCRADLLDAVERVIEEVEGLDLPARAERIDDLIDADINTDPMRECRGTDVSRYQASLRRWLEDRSGELEDIWGL